MSRKNFEMAAAVLLAAKPDFSNSSQFDKGKQVMWEKIVGEMADDFKTKNPAFNRARFLAACGASHLNLEN